MTQDSSARRRAETAFAPRDHQPWTLEEQEQVLAGNKCTDKALALKLGRSEQAIQTKRYHIHRNGFTEPTGSGYNHGAGAPVSWGSGTICPLCHLALPVTGRCDDCA